MLCAASAPGIGWQHLNHLNLLVGSVCRFHVYFHNTAFSNNTASFRHFFAHIRMVLARLKSLILNVHITVFVMIIVLMQMKD